MTTFRTATRILLVLTLALFAQLRPAGAQSTWPPPTVGRTNHTFRSNGNDYTVEWNRTLGIAKTQFTYQILMDPNPLGYLGVDVNLGSVAFTGQYPNPGGQSLNFSFDNPNGVSTALEDNDGYGRYIKTDASLDFTYGGEATVLVKDVVFRYKVTGPVRSAPYTISLWMAYGAATWGSAANNSRYYGEASAGSYAGTTYVQGSVAFLFGGTGVALHENASHSYGSLTLQTGWVIARPVTIDTTGIGYLDVAMPTFSYTLSEPTANQVASVKMPGLYDPSGNGSAFNTAETAIAYTRQEIRPIRVVGPGARTVSGTVTLQGSVNSAQSVTFEFRPTDGSTRFTRLYTLVPTGPQSATGTFSLDNIPPAAYNLAIKGAKWLRKVVAVNTVSADVTNVSATLKAGDANDDNSVDNLDQSLVAAAYGSSTGDPDFDPRADLNNDGSVDNVDLALLSSNYGLTGDN